MMEGYRMVLRRILLGEREGEDFFGDDFTGKQRFMVPYEPEEPAPSILDREVTWLEGIDEQEMQYLDARHVASNTFREFMSAEVKKRAGTAELARKGFNAAVEAVEATQDAAAGRRCRVDEERSVDALHVVDNWAFAVPILVSVPRGN